MLTKNIENLLNRQIAQEASASYYYLAMASWCECKGLGGAAKFLYKQSEEERSHMIKLFKYINEAGGHALAPEIKKLPQEFKTIVNVFELALKQEVDNTKSINNLVEACFKSKDYSTENFLQWYVAEQHEEEMVFKSILDIMKIIGTDGKGVYMIDKEIGKMAENESSS
ncbi:MAG: ferritin [Bacteroidia bacterium]|nr:ferritin [Bacteroidia bacterium]